MAPISSIVVDEGLCANDLAKRDGWVSRNLYWSDPGAANWLAVVREPTYPLRDTDNFGLKSRRTRALANRTVNTFVSLGPGDGIPDRDVVQALRPSSSMSSNPSLKYIPVDISRRLLEESMANLQGYAEIPLGLLCDFESGIEFLTRSLERHATAPILFGLMGGTLGNLDQGEQSFFEGMRSLMRPGDSLLMDVPLAGPGWTLALEPRLQHSGYTTTFRHFLAESVHNAAAENELSVQSLRDSFADWAILNCKFDAEIDAEVITVVDRHSDHKILQFRRHRWEPMLRRFESYGFAVEFAESSIESRQDAFGIGVVLLTPSLARRL